MGQSYSAVEMSAVQVQVNLIDQNEAKSAISVVVGQSSLGYFIAERCCFGHAKKLLAHIHSVWMII